MIDELKLALEEWRAARQAIFDRHNFPVDQEKDPLRWKRLSDAENKLMEIANKLVPHGV